MCVLEKFRTLQGSEQFQQLNDVHFFAMPIHVVSQHCSFRVSKLTSNNEFFLLVLKIYTKILNSTQVPFGSVAFMPGKLVHTNEIMVLLGDNWFAERSASQALEIVARRKKCTVINFM